MLLPVGLEAPESVESLATESALAAVALRALVEPAVSVVAEVSLMRPLEEPLARFGFFLAMMFL
jgi:hypothetical protein